MEKSYGQETRERNERLRGQPTREQVIADAREAEAMRNDRNYDPDVDPVIVAFTAMLVMFILTSLGSLLFKSDKAEYLENNCKMVAVEELPEERVNCGKACTRPARLETYQCGNQIKKFIR